jgi:hypothetical protein
MGGELALFNRRICCYLLTGKDYIDARLNKFLPIFNSRSPNLASREVLLETKPQEIPVNQVECIIHLTKFTFPLFAILALRELLT